MANIPAYEGEYKVFVFEEATQLSLPAANRLLKILEEPPDKVIWLLLSSEESLLLPTVVSRCQILKLKPMKVSGILEILEMEYGIEGSKAKLFAQLSQGCLGWAFSAIADKGTMEKRFRDMEIISSMLNIGIEERFTYAEKMATEVNRNRQVAVRYIRNTCSWWRDLMLIKGDCRENVVNIDYMEVLEEQAKCISIADIKDYITNLYSTEKQISRNVNARLAFESLMINMPRISILAK